MSVVFVSVAFKSVVGAAQGLVVARRVPWPRSVWRPLDWACVWLALTVLGVAIGPLRPAPRSVPAPIQVAAVAAGPAARGPKGQWIPTQDSWNEQLRSPSFWANRKSGGSSGSGGWQGGSGLLKTQPGSASNRQDVSLPWPQRSSRPARSSDDDDDDGSKGGSTYRTMCVRLCDGFFFPVSFATTKDNFDKDAALCARNCGGPEEAKLFTYRNPGGEISEMEDLDGKPYKKLQTAFLFRTKYDSACKCRAHPWEDAAVDRHKAYALADAAQKGNQVAARDLGQLKAKIGEATRLEIQQKASQAKARRDAALAVKAAADAELAARKAAKRAGRTGKPHDREATARPRVMTGGAAGGPATGPRAAMIEVGTPPVVHTPPATLLSVQARAANARSRLGDAVPPMAAPAGGRSGIVTLRLGNRPPVEISVPVATRAPISTVSDATPDGARSVPGGVQ